MAMAAIHRCWDQQIFLLETAIFFATTPATMIHSLLERQVLLLEPFSFFVASIISFCYDRFDFCWNKHPLFLLPSSWIFFGGTGVFLCYNCSSILLEPTHLFLFAIFMMASVRTMSVDGKRLAIATGAATVAIRAAIAGHSCCMHGVRDKCRRRPVTRTSGEGGR